MDQIDFGRKLFLGLHSVVYAPTGAHNRDGNGLAKRGNMGAVEVSRISSQCQKFYSRKGDWMREFVQTSGLGQTYRSRMIGPTKIKQNLIEAGFSADEAEDYGNAAVSFSTGSKKSSTRAADAAKKEKERKAKADKKKAEKAGVEYVGTASVEDDDVKTAAQPLVFGEDEIETMTIIAKLARERGLSASDLATHKDKEFTNTANKMFARSKGNAGADALLNGRMATSEHVGNITGGLFRSHLLGTHPISSVIDNFTVHDDLNTESGASHLNNIELVSGVHYGNLVLDLSQLARNFKDDRQTLVGAVRFAVSDYIYNTMWAKVGSTGAGAEVVEVVPEIYFKYQPVTYYGAFVDRPCYRPGDAAKTLRDYSKQQTNGRVGPGEILLPPTLTECRARGISITDAITDALGLTCLNTDGQISQIAA